MFGKNVAGQHIAVQGVDATTGGILTGATWTVRRCIDGTFAAATGTVTEDGTTGFYKFAMSQADTNGNNISFNFTATGAVPQTVTIVTGDATADAVLDEVVEGSRTLRQMLRGYSAALLAKASGLATTTAVFRDIDDSKDRITATVDADGNRSAITLDLT